MVVFLDDKVSGLEETISTGDLNFRFFLYHTQWSSTACFNNSRVRKSSFFGRNSILLCLLRFKVLLFSKIKQKFILSSHTYSIQDHRKFLKFNSQYNPWKIWWHFFSPNAHLLFLVWSKFLHHSDYFLRMCLLMSPLCFSFLTQSWI